MSKGTAVDTVSGLDYEEIEEAVMETARGRWFLTEFARRQRGADTRLLLDAIRRLEDQLLTMPATAGVSSGVGHLVEEAEDELKRLSGSAGAPADGSVSALDLAARLATITGNLRSAIDAPAENLADRIKPEIDKLDACATQQDEFAGKLARAAQMVRRLRSSDVITSDGLADKPEKQLCAPEKQAVSASPTPPAKVSPAKAPQHPAVQTIQPEPAPIKAAPAFVPSDDDIFETGDKPLATSGSATTCAGPGRSASPAVAPAAKGPDISSDTLNFANIDVAPLPDKVSGDEEPQADAAEKPIASAPAKATGPDPAHASGSDIEDDLPPEPDLDRPHKASSPADRIIQVTRSSSRPAQGQPAAPATPAGEPLSGRINMANPMAANQTAAPAAPNPAATTTQANSTANADGNGQKKRIIIIRRPADGTDGIPLAGDGATGSPDAPGAA
jgi:hypothetical protein